MFFCYSLKLFVELNLGLTYFLLHSALHDYESALKLDSQSRDLQKDVEKIKRIIQGSK